ncbi:MAG: efflux RND transporter periplasmic adaptor subunit [Gemmatimonadota bacterium]|nr:efflux RND transporter periplasmic adaptor subunit [Gemmatimonadota bacterium]
MPDIQRLVKAAAAALVVLTAACGGDGGGAASAASAGPGAGGGMPPTPVDVVRARTDTVVETIEANGAVEAVQYIELRPEVSGRLEEIQVSEGREVSRGTPLFKVDDAELRAEVDRLEAELDLAEQALARTRELIERNASSEADLEQAEATARSARARLTLERTRLERTVVRAPFAGAVGERYVSLGDYVTPQSVLTTLQTVDPIRISFQVPERYASNLAVGLEVEFRVAAVPGRTFRGTVDFVDPRVQLPGRTIVVKARVPNPDRVLRPGMFVEARLTIEERPDAVVVPEDAILPLEGADYVWTVTEDGTASRREVELGVRTFGFVEIRSGLEAGTPVVVGGLERLGEGAPVAPTFLERPGAPPPGSPRPRSPGSRTPT